MSEVATPSFLALSKALEKTTLTLHPSQVHGLVCGLLCGEAKERDSAWQDLVTGGDTNKKTHQVLQSLYDGCAGQLATFLLDVYPLLPDDDEELPLRAEALSLWCQGVLTGLKMANIQIVGRDPGEVTEAIDDLIEIAKMNYEDVVTSEEDENAYVELVEYVRMALILIYQVQHDVEVNDQSSPSSKLH